MADVNFIADFFSVILFQALLPVGVLIGCWVRVRRVRTIDFAKDRVYMTTNMRKNYV